MRAVTPKPNYNQAYSRLPASLNIDEIIVRGSTGPHMHRLRKKFMCRDAVLWVWHGIRVVIYDGSGCCLAARVGGCFALNAGRKMLALRTGGLAQMGLAEGRPTRGQPPIPRDRTMNRAVPEPARRGDVTQVGTTASNTQRHHKSLMAAARRPASRGGPPNHATVCVQVNPRFAQPALHSSLLNDEKH